MDTTTPVSPYITAKQEGTQFYSPLGSEGYGGLSYSLGGGVKGLHPNIQMGFLDQAALITGGSRGAAELLREGYRDQFAHRAGTVQAAQDEYGRRLGAESSASGLSPELVRRVMFGQGAESIRSQGIARGETSSALNTQLAELLKGTGTELAGLKADELETMLQALLAYKGRKVARKGLKYDLLGAGIGAAGMAIGGAASAGTGGGAGSGGGAG